MNGFIIKKPPIDFGIAFWNNCKEINMELIFFGLQIDFKKGVGAIVVGIPFILGIGIGHRWKRKYPEERK
jgi:hypothetical protein